MLTPGHMRRGRGELRNQYVLTVAPEHLRFRTIRQRVEIKPIGRRAVSLVARSDASRTAPFHPLRKHILHDQIGKRLPIVAFETRHDFRIALPGRERLPVVFQVVSALLLEPLKETRRPSGIVVFE